MKQNPIRFAWLSLVAAVITILLKVGAYILTDSVGLLSDALESTINVVAATIALITITVAHHPPDEEHAYGHHKAEYFSSGVEGTLIVVAALIIVISAVNRFFFFFPLQQLTIGAIVSGTAAIINFVVARTLLRASQQYHSVVLEADAHHLMSDVWTTTGVLIGLGAVTLTQWQWLDPVIALLVAIHIITIGSQLIKKAIAGLMDTALPLAERERIETILDQYKANGVTYHALRTRQSGPHRFVSVHIQVPGAWTVQQGHTLLEKIEQEIRQVLAPVSILTHLEPSEDPVSWLDIPLIREEN